MGFRIEDFRHHSGAPVETSESIVHTSEFRGELRFSLPVPELVESLSTNPIQLDLSIKNAIELLGVDSDSVDKKLIGTSVSERLRGIFEDLDSGDIDGGNYPVTIVEDCLTEGEKVDIAYPKVISGEAAKMGLFGEVIEDAIIRRVQLESLGFEVGRAGNIRNGLYSFRSDSQGGRHENLTLYRSPKLDNIYFGVLHATDDRNGVIITEDIYIGLPIPMHNGGMK